ncbi:hypothetical protein MYX78_09290, partial [Acidobacteria bacterium AH-259-G07]|nr:hypothetical protein [Acidobacteria bacterium AH-259-G07]
PASDDIFQIYRSLFSYERSELNAQVESADDTAEHWSKQRIILDAAYGNERLIIYLFLPKGRTPPYQVVVYFPGATAERRTSSEDLRGMGLLEPILRSGRAVLYPIYKGTYERSDQRTGRPPVYVGRYHNSEPLSPVRRDKLIMMARDLGRSIDYLETHSDMSRNQIAYFGHSLGARLGCIFLAIEERFKCAVFLNGGLHLTPKRLRLPELDELNFVPRVKLPLLMLNGRYDFGFPVDRSQLVLFRRLGTPEKDKRHVLYDRGHARPFLSNDEVREILDWLDRYLGPVKRP